MTAMVDQRADVTLQVLELFFFVFLSLFSVGDGLPLARKMESMEGP